MKNWLNLTAIGVLFVGIVCGSIYFAPHSDARMNACIYAGSTVAGGGGTSCASTGDEYTQSLEGTGYAANGDWGDETETLSGTNSDVDEDHTSNVACGSQAVRMHVETGFGKATITVTPDATISTEYYRTYLYVETDGLSDGGSNFIVTHLNGSAAGWRIDLEKSGSQLSLRFEYYDYGTFSWVTDETAYNISASTEYRIEVWYDGDGTGEGWEFRVDGATVDSGTENMGPDLNDLVYGVDPSGSDTLTVVMDGVDIDSSGWLGQ